MRLRHARLLAFAAAAPLCAVPTFAQTDALPSWNDSPAKQAIVKFVDDVTKEGAPTYVAPAERIAVFDNDGTLWSEQPLYFQLAFALEQVKAMAPQHPEWKTQEPFKTLLTGDVKAALGQGEKAVLQIMAATHTGMTTDEFAKSVGEWATTAKHPRSSRLYTEMVYQPMLELMSYLRANGFKTFIVSGGGVEFMRAWVEKVYGIPPEQVVGSSGVVKFEVRPSGPVLLKEPKVEFIDDGPGKPVGINRFIGRRRRVHAPLGRESVRHSARAGRGVIGRGQVRTRTGRQARPREAPQGRVRRRRAGQAGRHQPLHRTAADLGVR